MPRHELHPPASVDLHRLLAIALTGGDPFASVWTIALYFGCRRGELLGLSWDDVSLAAGSLTVRRTLLGARDTVPTFGEPRTSKSRRTETLPAPAIALLREHRHR